MATFAGFKSAPKVEKPAKASKSRTREVAMDDIADYAALSSMTKMIESIFKTLGKSIKDRATDMFIKEGLDKKVRPSNFKAIEGKHSAGVQLRKRGENSKLTPEEILVCKEFKIPVEQVNHRPETLMFNPIYMNDPDMMKKIEKALMNIKGLPDDIVLLQEGVYDTIVTDASIDAAFELPEEKCRTVLPFLTTLVLVPKFDIIGDDYAPMMDRIDAILKNTKNSDDDDC